MAKREILRISEEEPDDAFIWIGISCDEKDYCLAWGFKEFLNLRFIRQEDHRLFYAKGGVYQEFSWFTCSDLWDLSFQLVSNRCEQGYLLEEFKNVDFILYFIPNEDEPFDRTEFISELRRIPFIRGVYPLNLSAMKGKFRLP